MMRRSVLPVLAALAMTGAMAAELPAYPFVSTGGKAQTWLAPDIGELRFETGSQHVSAETAAATLDETSTAVAALLAGHAIPDTDIDGSDVSRKTTTLSRPTADGATETHTLERRYRVQVRELSRWPELVAALLALDHVGGLSVSFDRSDSDKVNLELLAQAADDARANGTLLAQSFGRQLGAAMAISRGPLEKVAPAIFGETGLGAQPVPPTPRPAGRYAVPPSIPFAQAVTAVFRLRDAASAGATTTRKPAR